MINIHFFRQPVALAVVAALNHLKTVATSTHEHATMEKVDSSNEQKIGSQLLFEIKLHGFLLWASVGFLMPVSILIKRMSTKEKSGRRLRIIFYAHAATEVLAVLLATAGAVMSIRYFNNAFNNDHQRVGLAFFVVMWLQVLSGIFRPKRGSKGRSVWFLFHWFVGISVSLLGVINIYTGMEAYQRRTSNCIRSWTIAFTVQIVLVLLLYLLQEKWHYTCKQGTILGNKPVQPTEQKMSSLGCQKRTLAEPC